MAWYPKEGRNFRILVNENADDNADIWVLMGTDTFFFPNDSFRVGLVVLSRDNNHLAKATFEHYELINYAFPTSSPIISNSPTSYDPRADMGDP